MVVLRATAPSQSGGHANFSNGAQRAGDDRTRQEKIIPTEQGDILGHKYCVCTALYFPVFGYVFFVYFRMIDCSMGSGVFGMAAMPNANPPELRVD